MRARKVTSRHRPEDDAKIIGTRRGLVVILGTRKTRSENGIIVECDCLCDCGTRWWMQKSNTRRVQSCGCIRSAKTVARSKTHGHSRTPEHRSWAGMKTRCSNPRQDTWRLYGGRGITVCERWSLFENFLSDMGPKPSARHSIDRIDVNRGYEPGNCRWATPHEQARNRRNIRMVKVDGVDMCLSDAAVLRGLTPRVVFSRLGHGWSVEDALSRPVRSWPSA